MKNNFGMEGIWTSKHDFQIKTTGHNTQKEILQSVHPSYSLLRGRNLGSDQKADVKTEVYAKSTRKDHATHKPQGTSDGRSNKKDNET